jgi:hypothetical protein
LQSGTAPANFESAKKKRRKEKKEHEFGDDTMQQAIPGAARHPSRIF